MRVLSRLCALRAALAAGLLALGASVPLPALAQTPETGAAAPAARNETPNNAPAEGDTAPAPASGSLFPAGGADALPAPPAPDASEPPAPPPDPEAAMREDRNLRIIQALTARLDKMTDEEIPRLRAEIAARDRLIADLRGADDLTEARIRMDRAYLDSWTAYYDHLEALRGHTRAVFAWQQFASDATLWLVVLVVLAGVGLSVYEITNSVRRAERAAARGGAEGAAPSSLTLSPGQVQITSAITGVVVLALSLGFLFLFLDRVYDIDEVHLKSGAPGAEAPE